MCSFPALQGRRRISSRFLLQHEKYGSRSTLAHQEPNTGHKSTPSRFSHQRPTALNREGAIISRDDPFYNNFPISRLSVDSMALIRFEENRLE
jgi:hypothetical protein